MKKRILTLVLMLALLISVVAISAQAATVPTDVEWIELDSEETFTEWFGGSKCKNLTQDYTAGMNRYYKLTDNITITTNSPVFYMSDTNVEVNVYLDLNGKTLTYNYIPETGNSSRFMGNYNANSTCTIVNGTMVYNSPAAGSHGAFITVSGGHLVMEDVIINDTNDYAMASDIYGKIISISAGNSATLKRVTITSASSKALGKGLIRNLGDLTMEDCSVTASTSGTMAAGGILYLGNATTTNLTGCTFTGGNGKTGGAIYAEGTSAAAITLSMTDCTFSGADATGTGGTICAKYTDMTITDCEFTGSTSVASSFGGIVYLESSLATISGSTFTNGKAQHGGALYCVNKPVTVENCTFTGGRATQNGGNIQAKNSTFTLINTEVSGGKADVAGGNICIANSCKAYFKSGTVSGGQAPNGGNIATAIGSTNGCYLYFQGTNVTGGTATTNGGNVYAVAATGYAGYPTVELSAGTITGGKATVNGGNVYVAGAAKEAATADKAAIAQRTAAFKMTGGTIGGTPAEGKKYAGEANGGGNIFATYATVSISKGEVSNSHAFNLAGNIYPSTAATVTISGTAVISGGVADDRGGNFYLSSTNSVLNISGGTVKDGFSYQPGGNIFINNGKVTITGGVVSGGVSEASGGNIYASMGYSASAYGPHLTIKDDGNASTPIPQIINGVALQDGGNIYAYFGGNSDKGNGRLVLGNAVISGGNAKGNGDELYINGVTILEILPEFAQNIPCYISNAATGMLPEKLPGAALANGRGVSSGVFTGKLTVENHDNIFIYAKDGDTGLYFAGAATVDANGTKTWYKNNADALAAYAGAAYLQAGSEELALAGGDYVVDIAGNTLNITGTGNVTCFDSANDDYKTYGAATISGPTLTNTTFAQVNGTNYYTIEADGAYTFHRLDMKIITASLRPSIGGIYYTGKWSCDDVLANKIEGFGVAASLVAMPGNDFATKDKPDSKWTVFAPEDFESGVSKTGVMISGILKDASSNASQDRIAKNAEYAQDKIYAVAYVTIEDTEYTGIGLSYSMYDILKVVSDNIEMYSDKAATLQDFMAHWSANGLTGEPFDSLNFVVSEDIVNLNALYAGLQPYYGELHDHAATGGTSDGKQSLAVWKSELARLNMDFATIVDHKQSAHMYLEDWDNAIFIGGSEAACTITDRTGVKLHYNMIFSDPKGLEAVVSSFSEFGWQYYSEDYTGTNAEKLAGGWHFSYPAFTAARFTEVCEAVYANGGFVALVHPKSTGYISSEDPADAYFMDGIAMEVFYTYLSTRDGWKTKANHKLWVDMMQAGYKVYATAGNDEHDMPSDKATSVIYAPERGADAWVQQLRKGTFIAGGVGVRSAIGDTIMGGTTSFEGKRFTFSVSDFHNSLYDPTHTYRVDVWDQNGVAFTEEIACNKTSYFAFDADKDANYYYIEIYDVTDDSMIAIGNPIWNADK